MDVQKDQPSNEKKGKRRGRIYSSAKKVVGGFIATSVGPTRVEMSEEHNELRIYVDGELKAQFTDGQLRFLDLGVVAANILYTGNSLNINALQQFGDITLHADEGDIWLETDGFIRMTLPTSSAGLPSGALWNDGGTVKII